VLTGRILTAENVTDSTKERLKQVLAPVVALGLPVLGVISDAQPTELLARFLEAEERTEEERQRLGHFLKVLTHLRPGLVQCYDLPAFPRTNNDMERTIRAIKMHYRRISGHKNWNSYLLRYGRCVAYQEWWHQQPDGEQRLGERLLHVDPTAFRQVRQQTRDRNLEQLHRYRFRHQPLSYLASLEKRWEQATGTGVLPP